MELPEFADDNTGENNPIRNLSGEPDDTRAFFKELNFLNRS